MPVDAALWLAALGVSAAAAAAPVTGRVADSQGLPVAGASVALSCGARRLQTRTDRAGRFSVERGPDDDRCRLVVTYRGFAPADIAIAPGAGEIAVRLAIAPQRETVNVHAPDDDERVPDRVGSASVSRAEMETVSRDTSDLVSYALLKAGSAQGLVDVYVDGLPAAALPPSTVVSRISVNDDPFAAEYADGDLTRVEIVTAAPDRVLRFNLGDGLPSFGGGGAPRPGDSSSTWAAPSVSGPVPGLPLTFSLQGRLTSTRIGQTVDAVTGGEPAAPVVTTSSRSAAASVNLFYAAPASRVAFSYDDDASRDSNAGAGGLTLPDAASAAVTRRRATRISFERYGSRLTWSTGVALNDTATRLSANSAVESVELLGYAERGGAPTSDSSRGGRDWTWKTVVQSAARGWRSGVMLSRETASLDEVPNPNGQLVVAAPAGGPANDAGPDAIWFASLRSAHVRGSAATVAPFFESPVRRSTRATITAGLRGDFWWDGQARGGLVSPRLSAVANLGGFMLRGGAGLFVRAWPESTMIDELAGSQLARVMVRRGGGATAGEPGVIVPIGASISPALRGPRHAMLSASVDRQFGRLGAGAAYSWTAGSHLLGSRRLPAADGFADRLESNRAMRRHEVRVRVLYRRAGSSIVANYAWVRSTDDTDGAFSFPADQDDPAGDWARSTGVAPQTATLAASLRLPAAISLAAIGSWRSPAPYSIFTGRDAAGNGLFNDRGGRPRNSGAGPAYRSVSLQARRRVPIGGWLRAGRLLADIGLQVDNVFGFRNYAALGSVAGSPLFQRPIGLMAGRSVRVSFNLDR